MAMPDLSLWPPTVHSIYLHIVDTLTICTCYIAVIYTAAILLIHTYYISLIIRMSLSTESMSRKHRKAWKCTTRISVPKSICRLLWQSNKGVLWSSCIQWYKRDTIYNGRIPQLTNFCMSWTFPGKHNIQLFSSETSCAQVEVWFHFFLPWNTCSAGHPSDTWPWIVGA